MLRLPDPICQDIAADWNGSKKDSNNSLKGLTNTVDHGNVVSAFEGMPSDWQMKTPEGREEITSGSHTYKPISINVVSLGKRYCVKPSKVLNSHPR
jgi:outer membrane scaffolding protein for murein synthesis (MipA/OmpV family)